MAEYDIDMDIGRRIDFQAQVYALMGHLFRNKDPRYKLYSRIIRNNGSEGYCIVFENMERFAQWDLYPIMQRGYRRADGAE